MCAFSRDCLYYDKWLENSQPKKLPMGRKFSCILVDCQEESFRGREPFGTLKYSWLSILLHKYNTRSKQTTDEETRWQCVWLVQGYGTENESGFYFKSLTVSNIVIGWLLLSCWTSFKNLHSLFIIGRKKFKHLSLAFKVYIIWFHSTNTALSVLHPQNLPSPS